jgi:superfamily II DNA/RNA helicase
MAARLEDEKRSAGGTYTIPRWTNVHQPDEVSDRILYYAYASIPNTNKKTTMGRGGKRRRERKGDAASLRRALEGKDNNDHNREISTSIHEKQQETKKTKYDHYDAGASANGRVCVRVIDHSLPGAGIDNNQNPDNSNILPKALDIDDIENRIEEAGNDDDDIKLLCSAFRSIAASMRATTKTTTASCWRPTLIQRHVWSLLLQTTYNVVSISPTGSGKTLSYALPSLIHRHTSVVQNSCAENIKSLHSTTDSILVLVPTRELVHQVASVYEKVIDGIRINSYEANNEKGTSKNSGRLMIVRIHGGVPREGQRRAIEQARKEQRRRQRQQQQQQQQGLFYEPLVLIATPGRFLDLLKEQQHDNDDQMHKKKDQKAESLMPTHMSYIVLDEADQLTKEGDLGPQVDNILNSVKSSTSRLVLVSATYPEKCGPKFLEWVGPIYIQVTVDEMKDRKAPLGTQNSEPSTIPENKMISGCTTTNEDKGVRPKAESLTEIPPHLEQIVHVCSEHKKPRKLINLLKQYEKKNRQSNTPFKGIIFYSKIDKLRQSERILQKEGIRCLPLHGQLSVEQRHKNLKFFTKFGGTLDSREKSGNEKMVMLLATDLAARGVDVPRINLVIQYDFPSNLEQYAHRCGRAGRSVSTDEPAGHHNDVNAGSQTQRYAVYSFFTRNLSALASDLVRLLERSNAWVDPNLRVLLLPEKPDHGGDELKKLKRNKGKSAKSLGVECKKIGEQEGLREEDDEDEEDESFLSGNRILLKRADHVSDASSEDDDDEDDE